MPKTKVTTLSLEAIDSFRSWLFGKARSQHTIRAYCSDLRTFLSESELSDNPQIDVATELEELGEAWLTRNRRILAPRTTARRLTSLRAFAEWAGFPELLNDYTAPDGGAVMPHPLPEGMDGVRRMLAATRNERQRCLVALCGMVGLRMAEALSVTAKDFTFQGTEVWLTVRGKGERTRTVPVSEEAYDQIIKPLVRAMSHGGEVVGLKDRFARRMITDLGEKAQLKRRVASHDLRATFATAVYDKTKDQRLVQWLLGHSSGRTTEGYIGVAQAQMRAGVEEL